MPIAVELTTKYKLQGLLWNASSQISDLDYSLSRERTELLRSETECHFIILRYSPDLVIEGDFTVWVKSFIQVKDPLPTFFIGESPNAWVNFSLSVFSGFAKGFTSMELVRSEKDLISKIELIAP